MAEILDAVERTALLMAALRAEETGRADRLYSDPYAARLAGDVGRGLVAELRRADLEQRPALRRAALEQGAERTSPSTPHYNYSAIRTRFFDDFLQQASRDPAMPQIVLAPVGLDSRAYRLDWPDHIRYFEVDRPAVLAFKGERLRGVRPRVDHRPVAVDLTSPDWESELSAAGYEPGQPSTWLMEGLFYYLSENDVHRVLDRVAAIMAPGSRIAADIVNEAMLTLPIMQVFADWGCPWLFGTDEPEALFDAHGFTVEAPQPGDPATDYGCRPGLVPPRGETGACRVFLVHGKRR